MDALPTTLRLIIVAGLLVGLSTSGVSPCLLAAANCDSDVSHRGAKVCCCQGKCDVRCNMACCQAPVPKQDRMPAPPKLSDEIAPTWGLAAAATDSINAATAADVRHGIFCHGAWIAAPPTLLALSVRLNV